MTQTPEKWPMFVDGKFVEADNQATYLVKNPANGSEVGIVPEASAADASRAIAAAARAYQSWSKSPAKERSHLLRPVEGILRDRVDEIAQLVTLENR